jgi:hypothetical protein
MIVTDLKYGLENRLIEKVDLIIERVSQEHPKKDALIIIEGGEGEGKTNTSVALGYYLKSKTKRDTHLFFKLEPLIQFAQSTEKKIIIWDEPALDALSTDWYKKVNLDLIRLLMTARKKRHIFIFNFTKFYKFSEYIVVDRCLALIHMYSRREIESGRFVYIRRKNLEALYLGYRMSKKRLYKKYTSFHGSFPEVLEKYFDKMGIYINDKVATYDDYEKEKDKSILSIGKEETKKESEDRKEVHELKYKISLIKCPIKTREELANKLGIVARTLEKWRVWYKNSGDIECPISYEQAQRIEYNNSGWMDVDDDVKQKDEVYQGIPRYTNTNGTTKELPAPD